MMRLGRSLMARLVAIQVLAWGASALLVAAFAPRLLLLDSDLAGGSVALAPAWLAGVGVVVTATVVTARRTGPILNQLAVGVGSLAPREVLALYSVPARLVALGLGGTLAVAAATLVAPLRPVTNDLSTQIELALLAMTVASVAALPAYVAMRAYVAKAMEQVSVASSREAIELLEARGSGITRVRRRLLAAVVAAVQAITDQIMGRLK